MEGAHLLKTIGGIPPGPAVEEDRSIERTYCTLKMSELSMLKMNLPSHCCQGEGFSTSRNSWDSSHKKISHICWLSSPAIIAPQGTYNKPVNLLGTKVRMKVLGVGSVKDQHLFVVTQCWTVLLNLTDRLIKSCHRSLMIVRGRLLSLFFYFEVFVPSYFAWRKCISSFTYNMEA